MISKSEKTQHFSKEAYSDVTQRLVATGNVFKELKHSTIDHHWLLNIHSSMHLLDKQMHTSVDI